MGELLRVLIIEDSDDDVELLMLELEGSDYELVVERVQTADQFMAALEGRVWDVVVSDFSLPGFSAPAALKLLADTGKDIPFIIVSGTIGEEAAVQAMRAGAGDFFAKNNIVRLIPAIEREVRDARDRQRRRFAEARLQRKAHLEKLLQEVAIQANSVASVTHLLQIVLDSVCEYAGTPVGHVFVPAADGTSDFVSAGLWHLDDPEYYAEFRAASESLRIAAGEGFIGKVIRTGKTLWVSDLVDYPIHLRGSVLRKLGLVTGFAFPAVVDAHVMMALEFYSTEHLANDDPLNEIIPQISAQISRVLERDRHYVALRQSEERFRQLFQALPIPVIISAKDDDTVLYTNDIYVSFLRANLNEFIGKPAPDFYYDAEERQRVLGRLARGETIQDLEVHARQQDGIEAWLLVSIQEIMIDERPALVTGFQDITADKEIERREYQQRTLAEALRDTAALLLNSTLDLDSVLDQILAQIFLVIPYDAAGVMLLEAGSAVRMAHTKGYNHDYTVEGSDDFNVQVEDRTFLKAMYDAMQPFVIRDTRSFEGWQEDLSDSWILSTVGAPLRIEGSIIGFLVLGSASTNTFTEAQGSTLQAFADLASTAIQNARLYAELHHYAATLEERVNERTAQLSEAKERVEAILNNSSDAIVLASFDGVIQQVNPAFATLFGYGAEDITGQSLLLLAEPQDVSSVMNALSEIVNHGGSARVEILSNRKNGTLFDADVALAAIFQEERIQGVVCGIRDITERKQAENEIRAALEKERELNELKSRFTSMVSHEFRTPLTVIASSAGLLQQYFDRMPEERKQIHFDQIEAQIGHLVELLNDVLTLSRAEAVTAELHGEPLDVKSLCKDLVTQIQQTTDQHQIEFQVSGTESHQVMDGKLMRQAISNLLSNAVKYSPNGGAVHLDLAFKESHLLIRVRDHGIGIPESDRERLFEAFHRARNVGSISGTGLGLAIVKQSVEAHGGTIDVDSVAGKGTTFTIRIPLRPSIGA